MERFLEIFREPDIIEAYKTCREGYNKRLLDEFICQLGIVINRVECDVQKYKTNDRRLFRLGSELLHILKTVEGVMVPPEEDERGLSISERLDNSLKRTMELLK